MTQSVLPASLFLLAAFVAPTTATAGCPVTPCLVGVVGTCKPEFRYMVKFRGAETPSSRAAGLAALADAAHRRGFEVTHVRAMAQGADVVQFRGASNEQIAALSAQLRRNGRIDYMTRDGIVREFADGPQAAQQWSLNLSQGIGASGTGGAWTMSEGLGVAVAVLDGGIAPHQDIDANVDFAHGYDFVISEQEVDSGDGNNRDADAHDPGNFGSPYVDCDRSTWHGTKVAGVLAAGRDNGRGIIGVAPRATIVPVRVLGRGGLGHASDVVDAIVWTSGGRVPTIRDVEGEPVAEVINLSLGFNEVCDPGMQAAIDYAGSRGVVVVAAAGNDTQDVAGVSPANCNGVIAVAATDRNKALANFSNFGPLVDISAPGVEIQATTNKGDTTPIASPTGDDYRQVRGTSFSAPHVAGVVAMMQAIRPNTPAEVLWILRDTKVAAACGAICGGGVVDAKRALERVRIPPAYTAGIVISYKPSPCPATQVEYTFMNSGNVPGAPATVRWTSSDGLTSNDRVSFKRFITRGTSVTISLGISDAAKGVSSAAVTVAPPACP